MKYIVLLSLLAQLAIGVSAQSELPKLYPTPEKVKVKLDFPREDVLLKMEAVIVPTLPCCKKKLKRSL